MSDERPIEKLLRRYAKKRSDDAGAPMEMHPATRRLLQGEVARQFRKAGAGKDSSTGWWAALRARWIYATAAVSAVVVATILVVNHNPPGVHKLAQQDAAPAQALAREPESELAKNFDSPSPPAAAAERSRQVAADSVNAPAPAPLDKQKATDEYKVAVSGAASVVTVAAGNREEAVPTLAPAAAPAVPVIADKELPPASLSRGAGEKSYADGRRLDEVAAAAAPASTPPPARSAPATARIRAPAADELGVATAGKDLKPPPALAAASPPAGAPAATTERRFVPIARGGGIERDRQASLSQTFANVPAKPKAEAAFTADAAAPVLLNFQVVQAGEQWQVIDADGSTYLGETTAAAEPTVVGDDAAKGATALKRQAKAPAGRPSEEATLNRFYRVAGTNRTLNQQVVFTWNFIAPTNAPGQSPTPALGVLNQSSLNNTQQFPGLYNNSGIIGRAQINSGKEIEVRATPVGP